MTDDIKNDDENQTSIPTAEKLKEGAQDIGAEAQAPASDAPTPADDLSDEELAQKLKEQQEQMAQEERDKIDRAVEERNKKSIEQALTEKERAAEEKEIERQKQLAHQINGFHRFFKMPGDFNPDVLSKVSDVAVKGKKMVLVLADKSGHVINTGKKIQFYGEQMSSTAASVIASEIIAQGWNNIKLKGSAQQKTMMAAALIEQDPKAVTKSGLHYKDLKQAVIDGEMSMDDYIQNMAEIIASYDQRITPTMGASVTGFSLKNKNVMNSILQALDFDRPEQTPSAEQDLPEISEAEHAQDMNQIEQALATHIEGLDSELETLKSSLENMNENMGDNPTPDMLDVKADLETQIDFYSKQRKMTADTLDKLQDISASEAVKNNSVEFKAHMSAFKTTYMSSNQLDIEGINDGLNQLANTIGYKSSHPDREIAVEHNKAVQTSVTRTTPAQQPKKESKAAPA